jgi:hypothetical protein
MHILKDGATVPQTNGHISQQEIDSLIAAQKRLNESINPETQRDFLEIRAKLTKLHGKELVKEIEDRHKWGQFEEAITIDDMLAFDRDEDPDNLIGKRWICRGTQSMLQGPTGIGKSSFIMQGSITWVLGKAFFGIAPVKPLRVLIVQDENDKGDMSECFQDMTNTMKERDELTDADMDELRENLVIRRVTGIRGEFSGYLQYAIDRYKPDLIIIDPLFAYAKGDVRSQEVMADMLRGEVNPILRKTGVTLIWNHHTGKPGEQGNGQEKSHEKKVYDGFGSSDIQNTMREVISLGRVNDDGLFEIHLGKRGRRAGIVDPKTLKPVTRFNIEHGQHGIVWQLATGQKATADKAKARNIKAYGMVRDLIVDRKSVTKPELKAWASKTAGVGVNSAQDYAEELCGDPEQKPRIWKYKRPAMIGPDGKKQKGEQPTVYSTIPPEGYEDIEASKYQAGRREVICLLTC